MVFYFYPSVTFREEKIFKLNMAISSTALDQIRNRHIVLENAFFQRKTRKIFE